MAGFEAGTVLAGRFEVVGILGSGGMATVYLVEDRLRGERIALKVLHPHLSRSPSMRARVRREVRTAARLSSEHALVAWDLHELDGHLALSMPLHRGGTLAEHLQQHGPLDAARLRRLALEVTEALSEAHHLGIVHRDVTPSNVMIDREGRAVLTDFGLARSQTQQTATGTGMLGTAGYAAPEIYRGVRTDPRSDLYSLGAVLYQAATGEPPFQAPDPVETLRRQVDGDYPPLAEARPDLPPALCATIEAMLESEPHLRPDGVEAVRDALVGRTRAEAGSTEPVVLPAGEWTVVVAEPEGHEERRQQLRVLCQHPWTRGDIRPLLPGVVRGPGAVDPTPERDLVAAVARVAGGEPEAVAIPSVLLHARFRLVRGVPEVEARQIAGAAEALGFDARVVPDEEQQWPPLARVVGRARWAGLGSGGVLGVLLASLAAASVSLPPMVVLPIPGWVAALMNFAMGAVLVFGLAALPPAVAVYVGWRTAHPRAVTAEGPSVPTAAEYRAQRWLGRAGVWSGAWVGFVALIIVAWLAVLPARALPFDAFLSAALSTVALVGAGVVGSALLGRRLERWARDHVERREQTSIAAAFTGGAMATRPATRTRAVTLHARAAEQIEALREALDAPHALPDVAVADLRHTLASLAARVDDLGALADRLSEELARLDDAGAAAEADRLERRLERLRTLARAGERDSQDVAHLERALEAHRGTLAQADALEERLTRIHTQLLEAGTTASRLRLKLLEDVDPGEIGTLLAQLDDEMERAVGATVEVAGAQEVASQAGLEPLPREPRVETLDPRAAPRVERLRSVP